MYDLINVVVVVCLFVYVDASVGASERERAYGVTALNRIIK